MGLDAATEALRWGVNDLGGTLMEESISRMAGADHGVKLDPDDLVARRPRAPAGRPPSARRCTRIRRHYELAAARRDELAARPAAAPRGRRRGHGVGADGRARARSRCARRVSHASTERTFTVEGHHYALVHVDRAAARRAPRRTRSRSTARSSGRSPTASSRRASCAPTRATTPVRIVFGSCRVAAPHEPPHTLRKDEHPRRARGRRAARARAARCADAARGVAARAAAARRPGLRRRGPSRTSRTRLDGDGRSRATTTTSRSTRAAWGEPVIRWLLSTVPSAMIFDDHDVHDDWNTSIEWVTEMRAEGVVAAADRGRVRELPRSTSTSGNLSPSERAEFELYEELRDGADPTRAAARVRQAGRRGGRRARAGATAATSARRAW